LVRHIFHIVVYVAARYLPQRLITQPVQCPQVGPETLGHSVHAGRQTGADGLEHHVVQRLLRSVGRF
jgi:hypothetical protein